MRTLLCPIVWLWCCSFVLYEESDDDDECDVVVRSCDGYGICGGSLLSLLRRRAMLDARDYDWDGLVWLLGGLVLDCLLYGLWIGVACCGECIDMVMCFGVGYVCLCLYNAEYE